MYHLIQGAPNYFDSDKGAFFHLNIQKAVQIFTYESFLCKIGVCIF